MCFVDTCIPIHFLLIDRTLSWSCVDELYSNQIAIIWIWPLCWTNFCHAIFKVATTPCFSLQVFLHLASHLASWGWWRPQLFRGLFSAPSQAGEARYLKRPLADRQWSQRSGGPGRPASSPERLFVAQTLPGSAYPFTSQAPSPTGPQLQPTTRPQLLIIWLMERHWSGTVRARGGPSL